MSRYSLGLLLIQLYPIRIFSEMPAKISIKELMNMPIEDLLREVKEQSSLSAKLRLSVKMNKEKDSAKYKNEKKQLARMKTVLRVKQMEAQKNELSKPEKSTNSKS